VGAAEITFRLPAEPEIRAGTGAEETARVTPLLEAEAVAWALTTVTVTRQAVGMGEHRFNGRLTRVLGILASMLSVVEAEVGAVRNRLVRETTRAATGHMER
jgi:hypothetical protein